MAERERVTAGEQEAENKRIAQIAKEARDASLARGKAEADARLAANTVPLVEEPTYRRREPMSPRVQVDKDGFILTRLHPDDLGSLRSMIRIADSAQRRGQAQAMEDALASVVSIARAVLARHGSEEE